MNCIKFSYPFPKLLGDAGQPITHAKLLQIVITDLSDLTAELIEYDTAAGTYPLPKKGKYMMLILQKPGGINLFTTLRRHTPEKMTFYTGQIGEWLRIQIEPKK